MATVNKDFRVKHGLIVEGTTGTINGNDILTVANTTSDLTEGTNLYFTDARVLNALDTAVDSIVLGGSKVTVNSNINANYDLEVAGTVTFQGAIVGIDTDDVVEATNLYFTDARAKTSAADLLTNATLTNIQITGDGNGLTITAENGVADSTTDDLTEGSNNLYFTDARAIAAVENATFTSLSASSIETDSITTGNGQLQVDTGVIISSSQGNASISVDGNTLATEGYADTAEADAISTSNAYTDSLIGDGTVDGTAGNTVTDRIATAIANLVDSAPATLDTLNELAAALGDDPNFVTTITTSIGEKVAKAGDTMTGFLTLHADPTSNLHAATKQYVDAVSTTVANLTTDDVTEGTNLYFTNQRAIDAINDTQITPSSVSFTADGYVEYQSTVVNGTGTAQAAREFASTADVTAGLATAIATVFYPAAKVIISAKANNGDRELSEMLVMADTSGNIYVTEYGNIFNNFSIGDISFNFTQGGFEILYLVDDAHYQDAVVTAFVTALIQ